MMCLFKCSGEMIVLIKWNDSKAGALPPLQPTQSPFYKSTTCVNAIPTHLTIPKGIHQTPSLNLRAFIHCRRTYVASLPNFSQVTVISPCGITSTRQASTPGLSTTSGVRITGTYRRYFTDSGSGSGYYGEEGGLLVGLESR